MYKIPWQLTNLTRIKNRGSPHPAFNRTLNSIVINVWNSVKMIDQSRNQWDEKLWWYPLEKFNSYTELLLSELRAGFAFDSASVCRSKRTSCWLFVCCWKVLTRPRMTSTKKGKSRTNLPGKGAGLSRIFSNEWNFRSRFWNGGELKIFLFNVYNTFEYIFMIRSGAPCTNIRAEG